MKVYRNPKRERGTPLSCLAYAAGLDCEAKRVLTPKQLQRWRENGYTIYNGQRLNVSLLEDLARLDVPSAARRIRCPVLILHGDTDEVVPVAEAHELNESLIGLKRLSIFTGTDHRFANPLIMRQAMTEALNWLTEHVR